MATQYAIDAVFRIIDNATAPMKSISQQGDVAARAMKKAELRMHAIGSAAKTAVKGAAVGAFAALGVGIASATKQYIEFDQAITSSGALFKDLDSTSESFGASMEALGKTARDVAAVTEFNAVDTAGALTKMAYAGMTSETAMALLAGTTDLATAAGTDLTTAVDIATDALGAFNLDATAGNLQRVSDVMAKTASTANTSLTDMFEAIKYAGPGFTAAGQSAETLSAAIGALANAGIKGSSAGTALQAVFTELAKGKKQDILAGYGVSIADAEGNFLNLYDIISQIEEKTASMSGVERSTFLDSVFGVRGGKAMNIILAQGSEAMKAYEAQLKNSAGAAAQMAAVMRGSIANQINVLKSGLTELGFKFVEAFKNQGSEALQNIITYVQNFDPAPLIATLTTAFDKLGGIVKAVWNMKEFLIPLIAGIEAYKVAMIALTAVMTGYEVVMELIKAAQAGTNAAMLANPVTVIALSIAGAVMIIVALWRHIEGLKTSFEGLWKKLQSNSIGQFISGVLTPLHNSLAAIFNIIDSFKHGGLSDGFKAIGKAILGGLFTPIQSLLNMLGAFPGMAWAKKISATMDENFFGGATAALQKGWEWIKTVSKAIGSFFVAAWEKAIIVLQPFFEIMKLIGTVFVAVWGKVTAALQVFLGIIRTVGAVIGTVLVAAWGKAIPVLQVFFEKIRTVGEAIGTIFMAVWGKVTAAIQMFSEKIRTVGEVIETAIVAGYGKITAVLQGSLEWIKTVGASIGSVFVEAWDKVTAALQGSLEWIKAVGESIGSFFVEVWGNVTSTFQGGLEWIKAAGESIGSFFVAAGEKIVGVFDVVVEKLTEVGNFFTGGGFISALKNIGTAILNFVLTPIESLLGVLSHIPGIGKYIGVGADKISNLKASLTADAPVTQGDRMAYSREESVSDVNLNVAMAPGLTGSVSGKAPGVSFTTTSSGSFGR